jgi:phospholipid/cholesterol/gamma-HCH transport system substrate-binding protein
MDNISTQVNPILAHVAHVVIGLDTVLSGINQILDEGSRANLRNGIAALNTTTENFAALSQRLNKESEALAAIIHNANSFMANLSKNNAYINTILGNVKTMSHQLAAAPLQETVQKVHDVAAGLDTLLAKINNGAGSIGMAVNDKKMYEELTHTLANLKSLMADIEAHPSRYINVTVFGRKQKN